MHYARIDGTIGNSTSTMATLSLPGGNWVIEATFGVEDRATTEVGVSCSLVATTTGFTHVMESFGALVRPGENKYTTMRAVGQFGASAYQVSVACAGGPARIASSNGLLTATAVGAAALG